MSGWQIGRNADNGNPLTPTLSPSGERESDRARRHSDHTCSRCGTMMRDNQGSNTMRDATFSRREVLGAAAGVAAVGALAEPRTTLADVAAAPAPGTEPDTRPAAAGGDSPSWVDPAMPAVTHRIIATNGIRIHVAEQGTGPLVILCHGFPESWYSWRHQLGALAQAGFRAVAFDLRGYGRSDRPDEVERYTLLHYIGDIVGLLDAFGVNQAVIAGHDVGATV